MFKVQTDGLKFRLGFSQSTLHFGIDVLFCKLSQLAWGKALTLLMSHPSHIFCVIWPVLPSPTSFSTFRCLPSWASNSGPPYCSSNEPSCVVPQSMSTNCFRLSGPIFVTTHPTPGSLLSAGSSSTLRLDFRNPQSRSWNIPAFDSLPLHTVLV